MIRLSHNEFCKYLNHLQKAEDAIHEIENAIDGSITDNCFGNVIDDHIAILGEACLVDEKRTEETIEMITEWLFWFCYDNNFGQEKLTIVDKEEEIVVSSIEIFYNYLNRFF